MEASSSTLAAAVEVDPTGAGLLAGEDGVAGGGRLAPAHAAVLGDFRGVADLRAARLLPNLQLDPGAAPLGELAQVGWGEERRTATACGDAAPAANAGCGVCSSTTLLPAVGVLAGVLRVAGEFLGAAQAAAPQGLAGGGEGRERGREGSGRMG